MATSIGRPIGDNEGADTGSGRPNARDPELTRADQRRVASVHRKYLMEGETFSTVALADAINVRLRTVQAWCAEMKRPRVDELRAELRAMAARDPLAARDFLAELLDLAELGWDLRQAAIPRPSVDRVSVAVLRLNAEGGDLARLAGEALADGRITPQESAQLAKEARDVEVAAQEVRALAAGVPDPQLRMGVK